jgi:hypothetical protein
VQPTGGGGNSVTIQFKEFGVRLSFTPTVLGGDLIHLKLRPEVSALDFAQAVELEGFRIPALSTRRTETEVELRDGQTFAIAGLMNNTVTSTMSKIPGIGDIPILGMLFRSKAHQKNQTELVVMITPTIIKKGQPGVSEGLPSPVEPYLDRPNKTYPNPDAYTGSPRYPVTQPPRGGDNNNQPQSPAPAPTAAAAPLPSRPVPAQQPAQTQEPRSITAVPAQVKTPDTSRSTSSPAAIQVTPSAKPTSAVQAVTPVTESARAEEPEPKPAPLTRDQMKALEKAREQQRKAEAAEAKRQAEEKRQADKLEKERAKREAEVARKNAELASKKTEEDQKRDKALAEAAARLKEAQAAYQAEMQKSKGGKGDK